MYKTLLEIKKSFNSFNNLNINVLNILAKVGLS